MYRAICITCHGPDGKGTAMRIALPQIPDFTDAKWQTSRTDADLQHSILEGKGQQMLPMKDKLALVHIDVHAMVGFVRTFGGGKQAIPAGEPMQPLPPELANLAASLPVPAAPPAATATTASQPSGVDPSMAAGSASAPETFTASLWAPPAVDSSVATNETPLSASAGAAGPATEATASTSSAIVQPPPAQLTPNLGAPASVAAVVSSAAAPAVKSEKLRAAASLFQANCIPCHGPDGRGTNVRLAFPTLPNFTARQFQAERTNAQMVASVLDGKGVLMPAWRGRLNPEQAQELVAYVRTFGPPDVAMNKGPQSKFSNNASDLRKQLEELRKQAKALSSP
jgi:mono/diheme cytochrome c family protein